MSQIMLNDPVRIGGSSALDLNDEVGIVSYLNAGRLALWAQDVNAMFGELYERFDGQFPALIPFSTTVPLTGGVTVRMPLQSITGPLAFTAAVSPVAGSACIVRLVSDGTHVPTFGSFVLSATSPSTWNSAAGVINRLLFSFDGTNYTYSFVSTAPVNAFQAGIASISVVHGVNPTVNVTTNGAALNPLAAPLPIAFTLASPGGASVNQVAVTATSITLKLTGTINVGDTVTLSYVPPLNSTFITASKNAAIRDVNNNQLAAFSQAVVIVS